MTKYFEVMFAMCDEGETRQFATSEVAESSKQQQKSDHAGYSPHNSLAACSYLSGNRVGFLAILISTHSSQNEIKC